MTMLPSRPSSKVSKQNCSDDILGRHDERPRWQSSNTSTASTTRVEGIQHWVGKARSLSNGRWLKRALGAALKCDRSISASCSSIIPIIGASVKRLCRIRWLPRRLNKLYIKMREVSADRSESTRPCRLSADYLSQLLYPSKIDGPYFP